MTSVSTLQCVCVLLSKVLCSQVKQSDSKWFKDYLDLNMIRMKRCYDYDFNSAKAFIEQQQSTAAFSPLCSDMNILLQVSKEEFGIEHSERGKKDLIMTMYQLQQNRNDDIFLALNCLYEKGDITRPEVIKDGYLSKVFSTSDALKVFNEHTRWLEEKSRGQLRTPLSVDLFSSADRIYTSLVYFKDCWARPFDLEKTRENVFCLPSGLCEVRDFMRSGEKFKYVKVEDGNLKYHIVALPYQQKIAGNYVRYMVYLIPFEKDADLVKLWDSFGCYSKMNIKNMIDHLNFKEIDLRIPKISHLKSTFDLKSLLKDVFKHHTGFSSASKMQTYLNIDEEGTEASAAAFTLVADGPTPRKPEVYADKSHLSFIFDMTWQRILFVTKDTGIIKND